MGKWPKYGILKKIYNFVYGKSNEDFLDELRYGGANIGKNVKVWDTKTVSIDQTRPWLLTIGDYTKITRGCVILTHDYSLSVLRRVYGDHIGEGLPTKIGENCFIGINSIILMGANIGNNVIVGAGSVVRGNVPDNVVIAGNPARVVCTLDQHYYNRKKATICEAQICAQEFYKKRGILPNEKDLAAFAWQFTPRSEEYISKYGVVFDASGDDADEKKEAFLNTKPIYKDFDDFLQFINFDN